MPPKTKYFRASFRDGIAIIPDPSKHIQGGIKLPHFFSLQPSVCKKFIIYGTDGGMEAVVSHAYDYIKLA